MLRARLLKHLPMAIALAAGVYVIAYPLSVTRYPPITDLPFHAAETSIFRHYSDPSWGFRDQFRLHPLDVPYVSLYALGALFALVVPIHVAVKCAAAILLALLPLGLGVLCHGMRKTPLWGILGLGVVWTHLTHWGFLNFVGAVGLFAMSVGFAFLTVDAPSRKRQVGLCLSLIAVFFTHGFRYPFAIAAVVLSVAVLYPATRRIRPVIAPILPSLALFSGYWLRSSGKSVAFGSQGARIDVRLQQIEKHLWTGFDGVSGATERTLFHGFASVALVLGLSAVIWFLAQGRMRKRHFRDWWWGMSVTLLPLLFAAAFFIAYLVLPMRIGAWWYVFPREITPALYLLLAAVPDMPKQSWFRLPIVGALAFTTGRIGLFVATEYRRFESVTRDFTTVAAHVPRAPKLLYLIFDHTGSARSTSPIVHLPAWIQAEKGGALSFHFATSEYGPVSYRKNGAAVPPPVPERWEWNPDWFQLARHGAWFDYFLVRRDGDPGWLFATEPSIQQVSHEGKWWLYHRTRN